MCCTGLRLGETGMRKLYVWSRCVPDVHESLDNL